MHLPAHTQTHTYWQSWVNRVHFLLLPWSNNGSFITGLTSKTVPREREKKKPRGWRKGEQTEIEGAAGWRKAKQAWQKKKTWRRVRSCYTQDILWSNFWHRNCISLPESELPTVMKYKDAHVFACGCIRVHVGFCLCLCKYLCVFLVLWSPCSSPMFWTWVSGQPLLLSPPPCLTPVCTDPCKDTTSTRNKPPLCFPSSFCISCLPRLSRKRSSSLPSSLPPFSPPFTLVWAFITALPPSSFYLSATMKESVREYVWGSIAYVLNSVCVRVCSCVCARTYVSLCVHISLSVQVFLCICD